MRTGLGPSLIPSIRRGPLETPGLHRDLAAGLFALVSLGLMGGAAVAAQEAVGAQVSLLSASDELVVFEVTHPRPAVGPIDIDGRAYVEVDLPGYDHVIEVGQPDLPVHYVQVALPPGAVAVAEVFERREELLAEGRPVPIPQQRGRRGDAGRDGVVRGPDLVELTYVEDPAVYERLGLFPDRLARAGEPRRWRHLKVAQIAVHPVAYDPQGERLYWYPRMRIEVRFVQTRDAQGGRISGPPYLRAEPRWDPIFQKRILNYERARSYKRMPAARSALQRPAFEEADWIVQIAVDTTEVYAVTYEQIAGAGAPVAGTPWADLSLQVREFREETDAGGVITSVRETHPIAMLPEDDGDGVFEPGEAFLFYGQDAWEFFGFEPREKRFLRKNVYWLVAGAGEGARMDSLPGDLGVAGLTPLRDFEHTIHFERNLYYMPVMARNEGSLGLQAFDIDHYIWTPPYARMVAGSNEPIKRLTLRMPRTDASLEMRIRLQGYSKLDAGSTHRPRLWLSRSAAVNDTTVMTWPLPDNPYPVPLTDSLLITLTEADLAAAAAAGAPFSTGANYMKIYLPTANDGIDNIKADGIGIDWVEVTYRGRFWLQYDRLFAPVENLSGVQQLMIERVSGSAAAPNALVALDVTDRRRPDVFALADSLFTPAGTNRWDLSLQVDFGAEPAERTFYFLEREEVRTVPDDWVKLQDVQALPAFTGEDYVVVYPRRLEETLEPLLAWRESQGHRVYPAPIEDVYAEYAGGRPHIYAIKYLVRELWRDGANPPPDYLFLVGDASNDIAGYSMGLERDNADTNHVPVMTLPGHFPQTEGLQIVSSDHWFVDNLGGAWDEMSNNEDMFIGRVPVATPGELAVYVEKAVDYEQQDETARWRHRLLMHSDGSFSDRNGNYYNADRGVFERITGNAVAFIRADSAFDHWQVDSLFHSIMMDSVVSLGRCVPDTADPSRCLRNAQGEIVLVNTPIDIVPNWTYGRNQGLDELLRLVNRGVLVWAYQGHSNRRQLAHEEIFVHRPVVALENVYDLGNIGRPFHFMGYGCHLAEFAGHDEGDSRTGLDAMAELMMTCCPGELKGALSVFASTDYEWIGHAIQEHVFQIMFQDVPQDEQEPPRSRWRLGEIYSVAKTLLSARDPQRLTYSYLGDPALRVGIEPPAMFLALNGKSWDPATMTELASQREEDSLQVALQIYDDSHVALPQIMDYVAGSYQYVPEELLTVVRDTTDDRRLRIEYDTQIQRRAYSLTFTSTDYEGTQRAITVKVPMAVVLFEKTSEGDLIRIDNGALISTGSSLHATVRCGATLAPEDVRLTIGEEVLLLEASSYQQEEGGVHTWALDFAGSVDPTAGVQALEAAVRQHDGEWLALQTYNVEYGDAPLTLRRVQWIPSPFVEESTLTYELTNRAGRARLRVWTVSGRRILDEYGLRTSKGMNAFVWDGRDADGDDVANGLYFYELTVWDESGNKVGSVLEKVVRAM